MKRLFIPLGIALLSHLILFYLPIGQRFAAPAQRRVRQTISLSLFRYQPPKKVTRANIQPQKLKPLPRPKIRTKPKPPLEQIPFAKPAPQVKQPSPPVLKPTPEPAEPTEIKTPSPVPTKPVEKIPVVSAPPLVQQETPALEQKIKEVFPVSKEPDSISKAVASREEPLLSQPDPGIKPEKPPKPKPSFPKKVIPAPVVETVIEAVPLYRSNPKPVYSTLARWRRYQGTVILAVLIDVDGKVSEVRIQKSSGYAALDRSALQSIVDWDFVPGKKGDQPIDMWVHVPIRFSLKK